ncbi:MAG: hypothetical protein WC676_03335 [Candidatus Omnitrophota bacterium]
MAKKGLVFFLWLIFFPVSLAHGENVFNFNGVVDFSARKINMTLSFENGSSIAFEGKFLAQENFEFQTKINHFKTPLFDISTELGSSFEVVREASGSFIRGALASQYSLFDYKPVDELSGHFIIKKGRLYLYSLSWGGIICDGYIGLFAPYEISLSLRFSDAQLAELLMWLGCPVEDRIFGQASGFIEVSGMTDKPILKGKILAYDGSIQGLEFDQLQINFFGSYPVVQLDNSLIAQSDGLSFNISGDFDLSRQCDFAGAMAAVKISPLVAESDIHREWTIKKKTEGSSSSSTEFKYRLRKQSEGLDSFDREADLLGVERSIKF